jgi:hypothetical protein
MTNDFTLTEAQGNLLDAIGYDWAEVFPGERWTAASLEKRGLVELYRDPNGDICEARVLFDTLDELMGVEI